MLLSHSDDYHNILSEYLHDKHTLTEWAEQYEVGARNYGMLNRTLSMLAGVSMNFYNIIKLKEHSEVNVHSFKRHSGWLPIYKRHLFTTQLKAFVKK